MADAHAGGFIGRPKPAQMAAMCGSCHQEAAKDWLRSPHFEARLKGNPAGASCTDCHAPASELTAHGIVHSNRDDSPASRLNIPLACARCHGNAAAMGASGSRADAFALYAASAHGRQVIEGKNPAAAVCSDCHSPHASLRSTDPASDSHPSRQAATCGGCHGDDKFMRGFDRSADPVRRFSGSPHARNLDAGAPSCAGCHGGHAARAPGPAEIRAACARCHAGPERALATGPHHGAEVLDPGGGSSAPLHCGHCHDVHGAPRPEGDFGAGVCASCHAEGTPARNAGTAIGALSAATRADLFRLHALLTRARVRGHDFGERCEILTAAEGRFDTLADLAHGVDPEACARARTAFEGEAASARAVLLPLAEPSRGASWIGWVWAMLFAGVALLHMKSVLARKR